MSQNINQNDGSNRAYSSKNLLLGFLSFMIALCGNGCGRSEAAEDSLKTEKESKVYLEKKYIYDPGSRNMKSHSLYVPRGWKLSGGTKWASPKYYRILPSNDISICSPEGIEARVYQTFSYSDPRVSNAYQYQFGIRRPADGSSDAGYPVRKFPDSTSAWKKEIKNRLMRERRPNANNVTIKNVTDFPELTKILKILNASSMKMIENQNRQVRMMGINSSMKMKIRTYVFEMEFEEGGKQFEEILVFGAVDTTTYTEGITQILWNVCPMISYRAPKGELEKNMPLLVTLTSSVRPTQEWSNMLFNHIARMNKIDRDAFDQRMALQRKTWSDMNRIRRQGDQNYNDTRDETQRKFINCIRGTSDYSHDGEEYQLPAGYDHVYTNGYDSIILTNDSLFNPNVDLQGSHSWSPMKQVR